MVAVMRLPVGPHPHSHGENGMFTPPVYSFAGSSPLTRGKLDPQSDQRNAHGLIPAHAGKTCGHHCRGGVARPHPRSRGENVLGQAQTAAHTGSSPLTRGKPSKPPGGGVAHGLIPAHAGKTTTTTSTSPALPAHPRSRGENHPSHQAAASRMGSSPLTRGKRRRPHPPPPRCRLIPAHAGKTMGSSPTPLPTAAHPRSRGENGVSPVVPTNQRGSSPLTRGKPGLLPVGDPRGGLIPAHAGKTLPQVPSQVGAGAHPRSRGENTSMESSVPTSVGSSPLTRGKRD